ncbi:MAG: hypothetical protein GWO39_12595, partial [Gammaproteobacteria bacterium]|nr:hypothetical protein [Gammaproteobacteria bacterium]NIY33154.1 hypothetical protein [Gammaproteobacteria bacterium]
MARRRVVLVAAALALCLGPPGTTLAQQGDKEGREERQERSCEEICGELAAQRCDEVESMECNFYILGCLSGCNYGKTI